MQRPGPASATRSTDPAHGFLHPVDLDRRAARARRVRRAARPRSDPTVHELGSDLASPDLVYPFDPLLVTDRGAIPLRPGKPNRLPEPGAIEAWTRAAGHRDPGRIEAPATIEGGDTFWLRPDLLCIGRTLRTNGEGARQLAALVGGDVRVFDVPYWRGPAELIHLLSVISPIADDLAVVFLPLLPVGPVAAPRRSRDPAARGLRTTNSRRSAATSSRSGPASSSWPRAIRRSRGPWPRPAARSTRTPRPRSASTARAVRPA